MNYRLFPHLHPLGVVVRNADGERELLIEGESCCGVDFESLRQAANRGEPVEVEPTHSSRCRLHQGGR